MKKIKIEIDPSLFEHARRLVIPVLLDGWFPPLEEWQHIENGFAAADGRTPPHVNPNLIAVEVTSK
jgi:hypothetical protein